MQLAVRRYSSFACTLSRARRSSRSQRSHSARRTRASAGALALRVQLPSRVRTSARRCRRGGDTRVLALRGAFVAARGEGLARRSDDVISWPRGQ